MSHFAGSPALTAVQFVDEVGLAMSGSTSADADAVNDADDDGGGVMTVMVIIMTSMTRHHVKRVSFPTFSCIVAITICRIWFKNTR